MASVVSDVTSTGILKLMLLYSIIKSAFPLKVLKSNEKIFMLSSSSGDEVTRTVSPVDILTELTEDGAAIKSGPELHKQHPQQTVVVGG